MSALQDKPLKVVSRASVPFLDWLQPFVVVPKLSSRSRSTNSTRTSGRSQFREMSHVALTYFFTRRSFRPRLLTWSSGDRPQAVGSPLACVSRHKTPRAASASLRRKCWRTTRALPLGTYAGSFVLGVVALHHKACRRPSALPSRCFGASRRRRARYCSPAATTSASLVVGWTGPHCSGGFSPGYQSGARNEFAFVKFKPCGIAPCFSRKVPANPAFNADASRQNRRSRLLTQR